MSRPTLLCFNLPADKLARVRFVCMRVSVLAVEVRAEDCLQPLGALCGLCPRLPGLGAPEEPFTGEMVVMASMSRQQTDRFLTALRQAKITLPLKAVVTPTNARWDAVTLHRELAREYEAFMNHESADHPAQTHPSDPQEE
ncbi:MAG: DUF3783 domain-containing protein [Aristaeellaceae bacterium]